MLEERTFEETSSRQKNYFYANPVDLAATETKIRRFLIVGSCFAGTLEFHNKNPLNCPSDFVLVNNLSELNLTPPRDISEYDFQIVQLPLQYILNTPRKLVHFQYNDIGAYEQLFDEARSRLGALLRRLMAWNIKYGILTFVSNFFVPQQNLNGRLLPRYDLRNPMFFVERLNMELEALLLKYQNAFLLDADKLSAMFGRMYTQDDSILDFSHASFLPMHRLDKTPRIEPLPSMGEHYDVRWTRHVRPALWAEIIAMYRTARQIDSVKLVAFDLDDTLWMGISGDEEDVGFHMIEGWPVGVIEALHYLKRRGLLLAIISKNDEARIRSIWDKIFGHRLKIEDFVAVKINQMPKTENMKKLLQEVNLLSRNTVFIDDNPVERAGMKYAFPEMRVLGKYPYYLRRILLWAPETQVPFITEESVRRTQMVQAQIDREAARSEQSRNEFLASLEIKITFFEISDAGHKRFPRVFELINKTNQFNTTGRRWKQEDFASFLAGGGRLYAFEVEDRYTAYGLVGVLIVTDGTIVQFVMSCRVVGMDVELAVLYKLVSLLRKSGHKQIIADLLSTDANLLCRDVFERAGFTQQIDRKILAEGVTIVCPSHIQFTSATNSESKTDNQSNQTDFART